MIYLITGKPGAGKSYFVSRKIKEWINEGFYVLTNVIVYPLTLKVFGYEIINEHKKFSQRYFYFNDDIDIKEFWAFSQSILGKKIKEGSIKLIIDEGLLLISKKFNEGKKELIKFLTQHRKLGYDIYILAQSKMELDTTIKSLVDKLIMVKYVREVFLIDIPNIRLVYERNINTNEIFTLSFLFINPLFYRFYESYKIHLKVKEKEQIDKEIKNILSWQDIAGVLTPAI
jgi:nucleoside-triphosphatase THEP1